MAEIGQFACLEVVSTGAFGAFVDVGREKDVLLPFREQTRDVRPGDWVIVYLFKDSTNRDCASMRTDKFLERTSDEYEVDDRVSLLIESRTDLGYRAIIENRHLGVLYANEVFQALKIGQRIDGFIKNIRPDGKIDLQLQRNGIKDARDIGQKILDELYAERDFLPLHDKSSAEEIYARFGVSKKKFKMAVGGLLKRRLISLDDRGMRLLANERLPELED